MGKKSKMGSIQMHDEDFVKFDEFMSDYEPTEQFLMEVTKLAERYGFKRIPFEKDVLESSEDGCMPNFQELILNIEGKYRKHLSASDKGILTKFLRGGKMPRMFQS